MSTQGLTCVSKRHARHKRPKPPEAFYDRKRNGGCQRPPLRRPAETRKIARCAHCFQTRILHATTVRGAPRRRGRPLERRVATLLRLAAAMKLAAYEAIRSHLLSLPCNVFPDMDALKAQHPGVSLDALVSICSQESARRIKANHGRHVRGIEAHAKRYLAGEDVFDIADQIDFPPCQLMRLLLEHLLSLSHKSVGPCMRDPFGKIPASPPERTPAHAHGPALCARLRSDVERCVAWDHVASPAVDTLRHTAGREYEDLLEHSLTKLGVPFVTEQALRAEGHAKTPDIKLELPIAVKGRVVNWIDSKASFCDPLVHVERGAEQFQGYVNRFGPGMVVYWLGVIDEVADESVGDVLLVDDFPDEADVVKLKLHTHDAREAGSDEA